MHQLNCVSIFLIFLTAITCSNGYPSALANQSNLAPRSLTCESGLICDSYVYAVDLYNLCPFSIVYCDCYGVTTPEPVTCPYPETCEPCETITCPPCPTCPTYDPPNTPECPEVTSPLCPTYDPPTTPECPEVTFPTCPTQLPCTCPTQPPFTCPTERTCPTPPPCPTSTSTTSQPCPGPPPTFTETFYQTSLASWPREGQLLRLGLEASTPGNDPISYELVSPPSFIILENNRDIRFTSDVSEGAFVGPNNVLIGKVAAYVEGQPGRRATATTVIIFPRSVNKMEAEDADEEWFNN